MNQFNPVVKSYEEHRYERLLETLDDYFCFLDENQENLFIKDLTRALNESREHPVKLLNAIDEIKRQLFIE